jgi:large subunit ribosomal protein L30
MSKKMFKIKQIGSGIRRNASQRRTLLGLGLGKLNRVRELEDTPSIRGMVEKVKHMVEVLL